MALHECPTCSAMVRNPDIHLAWHNEAGSTAPGSLEEMTRAQAARFAATARELEAEPSPDFDTARNQAAAIRAALTKAETP